MPTDERRRTSADVETTRSFRADLEQPGEARRFTAQALDRLGAAQVTDDAEIIVSELATNAVLHARCGFTVKLRRDRNCLHISVSDGSDRLPTLKAASAQRNSGRGLRVVEALAEAWGTKRTTKGKSVWVRLHLPPEPRPGTPGPGTSGPEP